MKIKEIKLVSISLTNFKGVRKIEANFLPNVNVIAGGNGLGKTTIFDAFTWLLFGKDSQERKQFEIKTYDKDGNIIPKLPHEVAAVISVDGEQLTLKRVYLEKWQKKRCAIEQEFVGNKEEFYWNEVPLPLKEWQTKIASLCDEGIFKLITNPMYFTSLKPMSQRELLFSMIDGFSDISFAQNKPEFANLLKVLTGKTLEEYKKELCAKKRDYKQEIERIPQRIDERNRDIPEEDNWAFIESDIVAKTKALEELDLRISSISNANSAAEEAKLSIVKQISDLRLKLDERSYAITTEANTNYYTNAAKKVELEGNAKAITMNIQHLKDSITTLSSKLDEKNKERASLISQWQGIKARQLVFNNEDLCCPTCKRPLEHGDAEAQKEKMTQHFHSTNAADLATNIEHGQRVKAEIVKLESDIELNKTSIAKLTEELESIHNQISSLNTTKLTKEEEQELIGKDVDYQSILKNIMQLRAESEKPIDASDNTELINERKLIRDTISVLKVRLSKKDIRESSLKRINELESQLRKQTLLLTAIEKEEFDIQTFTKAKITAIEDEINSKFRTLKFKMFKTLINGDEVETCEALIDGIPFSTANNAKQINAGIEIINAFTKFHEIEAPIFIDNAEAVNELCETSSQLIRLVVTTDSNLIIN